MVSVDEFDDTFRRFASRFDGFKLLAIDLPSISRIRCTVIQLFFTVKAVASVSPRVRHSRCRFVSLGYTLRWYFQHAHFIPIVGVGKRGAH